MRELYSIMEKENAEENEDKPFENKQLNADWEQVFRMKTPVIGRKKSEVLNASFLVWVLLENRINE